MSSYSASVARKHGFAVQGVKMYTNAKATVYRLLNGKYERLYLPAVFWSANTSATTGKTGTTESDALAVYVPSELHLTPQKDLIIKGSVSLTIDNSSDEAQSLSVKRLFDGYDVHTVMTCKVCDYGSKRMRHTELTVK